jgi:hypothetical protein
MGGLLLSVLAGDPTGSDDSTVETGTTDCTGDDGEDGGGELAGKVFPTWGGHVGGEVTDPVEGLLERRLED